MKKKLQLNKETMSILNANEMSKVVGQAGSECPAEEGPTVLLPNPADCASFFSCSQGVAILMHCPDGLYFNAELDVCDWPQNVDCPADSIVVISTGRSCLSYCPDNQ